MMQNNYPWLTSYSSNIAWDAEIAERPLFSLLEDNISKFGKNTAIDFMDKKYSWQEIYDLSKKLACALQKLGIGKGHRVGLFLPNSPYYIYAYYGILQTGATVVNFNPLYPEHELIDLINLSETEIMITTDLKMLFDKMNAVMGKTTLKKLIICPFKSILPFPKNILFSVFKAGELACVPKNKDILWLPALMHNNGQIKPVSIDPKNDLALLQFTGGTTGTPKAAMLTHYNLYANAIQSARWFAKVKGGEDKMMGILPFFHVFAMTAIMNFSVALGLEIIALPRFDLKQTLNILHKKRPSLLVAVPAIYNAINNSPDLAKYDLSSLKYCLSGGAPLTLEIKKTFEGKTGCTVIEGYGLTESSPVACANPIEGPYHEGSIGLPYPRTIVEIIDPSDKTTPMPFGERGELCIRGPQVMKGYWKNPQSTQDVLRDTGDGDKRLHTGDIAIMKEDGFVYIVDRIKDMIITNGYNVYPRNVEEAIYKHPAIEECIVAGIPDRDRGEIVKCWIKCKNGHSLDEEGLKKFLKTLLSPMEIPRRYEFRDQPLPKTMIGKLSRKDVLAQEKPV